MNHRLATVLLLVLDNWSLQDFHAHASRELLDVIRRRQGRRSDVVASQVLADRRPGAIGKSSVADNAPDRFVRNACRIEFG